MDCDAPRKAQRMEILAMIHNLCARWSKCSALTQRGTTDLTTAEKLDSKQVPFLQ